MCVRIQVRERAKPLRFCNRYLVRGATDGEGGLGAGGALLCSFIEAVTAVDEFNFRRLHVTGVEVNLKIRRGLRQAFLLDARGPSVVRRGRTARLRVRLQEIRGEPRLRTLLVRVPRNIPKGDRRMAIEGTPSDAAAGLEVDLGELLFGADGGEEDAPDEAGPRSVSALADVVSGLTRFDGVSASFPAEGDEDLSLDELGEAADGPEGAARRPRPVLTDPRLRLSGSVEVPVTVR